MITKLRLENFKAHRDTEIVLPRLAVLVGDNASGKTSVLEAIQLPQQLARGDKDLDESAEFVRRDTHETNLKFSGKDWQGTLSLTNDNSNWMLGTSIQSSQLQVKPGSQLEQLSTLLGQAKLYRLRADQVAAAAYSANSSTTVAEDGAQTAVVLADLKLADDERFGQIEGALCKLVPSVQRIRIAPAMLYAGNNLQQVRGSKVHFDFRGAKNVPAHLASQGTLVVLALLTALHGNDRPNIVLLDDFDHSLHPRAQMELVRLLKSFVELDDFKNTQIVLTTHSPYVLDEVSPSDVIAFALRDDGTVASKPLSEHPDASKVNGSLKAGELWSLDAERDWVL